MLECHEHHFNLSSVRIDGDDLWGGQLKVEAHQDIAITSIDLGSTQASQYGKKSVV